MICAHCGKKINLDQVTEQRGKGFSASIRCPLCQAWLGRSAWLLRLKLAAFYITMLAVICAWWWPEHRAVATISAIFSGIVLLVSHLLDQLIVLERPAQVDHSQERQKYR